MALNISDSGLFKVLRRNYPNIFFAYICTFFFSFSPYLYNINVCKIVWLEFILLSLCSVDNHKGKKTYGIKWFFFEWWHLCLFFFWFFPPFFVLVISTMDELKLILMLLSYQLCYIYYYVLINKVSPVCLIPCPFVLPFFFFVSYIEYQRWCMQRGCLSLFYFVLNIIRLHRITSSCVCVSLQILLHSL